MALTKINLANFVTGTLADGNIPDNITIDVASASPAGSLTGNTLASGVTASSLTSVGTLTGLTVATDNENIARFDGLQGNIDFRYGSDIEFDRAGQVYITANNGSGELNFRTGGQNIAMHIDSSQRVGIGTDSPGYLTELRVNDTTVDTPRFVIRQLGTGDASLGFQVPDSPYGWVMGADQSSDECFVLGTGVGNLASAKKLQVNTTGFVIINDNDTGSAGSSLKQLSLGDSNSTQFDRTNVGTFTGITVSNSYTDESNQSGTATGIAFTHHASSSGISYIASVAGANGGDRSALHFGTRGSSGVKERFMLNDNGEVKIGHGGDGYLYHYQINSNAHIWLLYAHSDDSYRFNRNGSGSDEMRIESDGDVHILGSLTQNSDIRLKKNIKTIDNALSKVNQLRGVTYNWKVSAGKNTDTKEIGMIADEVEKVIPELVKTDSVKGSFDEDGLDDMKSLKYGNVVGLLVEAVKELSAKVSELEKN